MFDTLHCWYNVARYSLSPCRPNSDVGLVFSSRSLHQEGNTNREQANESMTRTKLKELERCRMRVFLKGITQYDQDKIKA